MDGQTEHSVESLVALLNSDPREFLITAAHLFVAQEEDEFEADLEMEEVIETLEDSHTSLFDGAITIDGVHSRGGYEGEGESVERVFRVDVAGENVAYIQINGFYASYCGTEWDDEAFLVEPRDVMVTQYFKKGE